MQPHQIYYTTLYEELGFHRLLWWNYTINILTTSFIRFSLKGVDNVLFELGSERVNASCRHLAVQVLSAATIWKLLIAQSRRVTENVSQGTPGFSQKVPVRTLESQTATMKNWKLLPEVNWSSEMMMFITLKSDCRAQWRSVVSPYVRPHIR